MSEIHPSDEQLLLYADGEDIRSVEEHVSACPECREAVDAASRGAEALRSAPLLELPVARREEALASLPPRQRSRRPGRRFLRVAVPLVALASVVAVVGLSRGTTGPERTAEQMAAEDAARDAPAAALEAAPAEDEAAREPAAVVRSVAGPPQAVAGLLRAEGLDARIVDGAIEVRGAQAEQVDEALRGRADGPVQVRLVAP